MSCSKVLWEFFKDFSGPIATVVAAIVAAYFVRQQWRTAEKQADTALDQLRYNLFEKRYAIYDDVKQLLRLLLDESYNQTFNPLQVAQHYVVMDEAMFFFSPETCAWLQSVQKDCQKFLEEHASFPTVEYNSTEYGKAQRRLLDHLKAMPERFRNELSFRQLTKKGA